MDYLIASVFQLRRIDLLPRGKIHYSPGTTGIAPPDLPHHSPRRAFFQSPDPRNTEVLHVEKKWIGKTIHAENNGRTGRSNISNANHSYTVILIIP